jgi:hypothetical protein
MKPTPLATAIASVVATIRYRSLIAAVTAEEPDAVTFEEPDAVTVEEPGTTLMTVMTVGVVPGAADNVFIPEELAVNGKLFNVAPLT